MANIQQRGENSYFFTVVAGTDDRGKKIRKTKTIKITPEDFKTQRKLDNYLESEYVKFRDEVMRGEFIAPDRITLSSFSEKWIEKHAKKHLELSTVEKYQTQLKAHIIPKLGDKRLSAITTVDIVDFLDDLEKNGRSDKKGGLSSTSARYIHRVLKDLFARAVEWRVIPVSPMDGARRPKVAKRKASVLNEDDVAKYFAAMDQFEIVCTDKDRAKFWRLFITLALTTGLRRGELLALEEKHVNIDDCWIEVRQALSYAGKQAIIKEPKTESSIRRVSISASLAAEIKAHIIRVKRDRLAMGDMWEGGEYLFLFSATRGKAMYHTVPGTWLRRFIKEYKLPQIRFHDLRHTSATLMINQGVHAKTISARLGHADVRTTLNIYSHALESADQAAAATFDKFLKKQQL